LDVSSLNLRRFQKRGWRTPIAEVFVRRSGLLGTHSRKARSASSVLQIAKMKYLSCATAITLKYRNNSAVVTKHSLQLRSLLLARKKNASASKDAAMRNSMRLMEHQRRNQSTANSQLGQSRGPYHRDLFPPRYHTLFVFDLLKQLLKDSFDDTILNLTSGRAPKKSLRT
jgi:hypothetical protein